MIDGEIVDRAIEPRLRGADLLELGVKLHKGVLHEVLREREIAEQAPGISEQRRLEGGEDLLDRLPLGSGGAGVIRGFHGYGLGSGGVIGELSRGRVKMRLGRTSFRG